MNNLHLSKHYDEFDYLSTDARDDLVGRALKRQIKNLRHNFEFYKKFYDGFENLERYSLEDIVNVLPKLTKRLLRNLAPLALLPDTLFSDPANLPYVQKNTGGSSGHAVQIFYTKRDWEHALYAHQRFLTEVFSMTKKNVIAYNNYSHGHIAGPVFSQAVSISGGLAINRGFNIDETQALQELCKLKCNMIIAPPDSTHKGGTLRSLLDEDASSGTNYINGDNIYMVLTSSLPLTDSLRDELYSLGIKKVMNFYGQTEVMPLAVSCPDNSSELHVCEGHAYVAIVDANFRPIKNGERGMIITGRINALDADNAVSNSTGILNYITGDTATLITDNCQCGRTTSRIVNVTRELDIESKLSSGCQTW